MLFYSHEETKTNTTDAEKRSGIIGAFAKWNTTELLPGCIQNPHSHQFISEIFYVEIGSIVIFEWEGENITKQPAGKGDMFIFTPGKFHNIANESHELAKIHTVKVLLDSSINGNEFATLVQQDWIPQDTDKIQ